MYAILKDTDRIVLRHEVPTDVRQDAGATPGQVTILVSDTHDESSYVMWRAPQTNLPEDAWNIMWRGEWKPAVRFYTDYIGDLEMEIAGS